MTTQNTCTTIGGGEMILKRGYNVVIEEVAVLQMGAHQRGESIPWNHYFKSEAELLATLKSLDLNKLHCLVRYRVIQGYEYIISFARQLQNGKELSEKQIVQCKRLSVQIYKASLLMEYVE